MEWRFDPRQLRTLESVVRLGSFSAAADELGYTQSAVSQQISELERRVGSRVVARRPVRPTETGRVLLGTETAIGTAMTRAAAELAALTAGDAGELRLGAFISAAAAIAPPALALLRASHPGLTVTLRELEQRQMYAALLRDQIDLAVTFDYRHAPDPPPEGILRRHLTDDPVMVALPAGHPLAGSGEVDPHDVGSHEWINTAVADGGLDLTSSGDDHEHRLTFDGQDFRTALNLVAAGLGVALLPRLSLLDAPPEVVARPLRRPGVVRRIHTCRLDTGHVSASVGRLQTCLEQALA